MEGLEKIDDETDALDITFVKVSTACPKCRVQRKALNPPKSQMDGTRNSDFSNFSLRRSCLNQGWLDKAKAN